MEPLEQPQQHTATLRAGDYRVLVGLVLFAFFLRMLVASLLPFPSLDDPALYYTTAAHLAEGRGLVSDVIWSHLVPFDSVSHPSNEHWMPLTVFVLAAAFAVAGTSLTIAQAVGALLGALVACLAWLIARDALAPTDGWRWRALFAGALVALNPLLVYQSVTVDSAVYFTLLGGACIWLAGRTPQGATPHPLVGVLAGLSYLARSEGIVLLAFIAARTWKDAPPSERIRQLAILVVPAALVMAPWLLRNTLTFGAPLPVPTLALALLPDYPTLFHYGQPSYWDGLPPLPIGEIVVSRIAGLIHNLFVLVGQALFPWAFFLPAGLIASSHRSPLGTATAAMVALFLASALLFPVLTLSGSFYHAVGAVLPGLTVAGLLGAERIGRILGGRFFSDPEFLSMLSVVAAAALTMAQLGLFAGYAAELHHSWQQEFGDASAWLQERDAGAVLSTQPHSLNYASGLPAVMLPASDSPAVAEQVARRYGARYVVGFGRFGLYPDVLDSPEGAAFTQAYRNGNVWIYELQDAP